MSKRKEVGIGLLGLGVVGSGVAGTLQEKSSSLAHQVGLPLVLKRVLVRDAAKKRQVAIDPGLLTTNAADIIDDPEIDIVVEVIGGEEPAWQYIKEAILAGKHIVTANKEVMAKHGRELRALADEQQVGVLYEGSVGGGIPLVASFQEDLLANDISAIHAIINGTTNYILTRMADEGIDFPSALRHAQELGYAEADPANDVEGVDAAYKIAILASLAFNTEVRPEDVHREGISQLAAQDFRYARELGYAIKLLAIAKREDDSVQVRVHPVFIPEDMLLAKVDGVYNAIQVEGDLVGRVIFYGRGAGSLPTASAVVADIVQLAQSIRLGMGARPRRKLDVARKIKPVAELETRYYLRMTIADRPGVLAQIAKVLGDHLISIASVIQKEADAQAQTAEIVIMTHPAREAGVQQAIAEMTRFEVVKEISNCIRVED